jgi:hypothetical protein
VGEKQTKPGSKNAKRGETANQSRPAQGEIDARGVLAYGLQQGFKVGICNSGGDFKNVRPLLLDRVIREIGTHLLSRHGRGKKSASIPVRSPAEAQTSVADRIADQLG